MKTLNAFIPLGILTLLLSFPAAADPGEIVGLTSNGVLDKVVTSFNTRAVAWQGVIAAAASWLFWTLGTISFAWTMGMLALKKADIGDFFTEFIRFTMFFGFFYWLLKNGPLLAEAIIHSMRIIGQNAAGTDGISPSGIVNIGFSIWGKAIKNLSMWSPVDSFVGVLLSVGILVLLTVVALNMLILFISAWVLMYAGIFFLGFGGSRWTSDMAINYFKTVFGLAVQLFAMTLIIGIGQDLLSEFYERMNKGQLKFEELGVMIVFCIALLYLVQRVPHMLAAVVSGGGGASGLANLGPGAVFSTGAMGAAAIATAGASLAAGATGIAGGAQAVMAAYSKASESANASAGGASALFAAPRGGGDGNDSGGGGSALASAMGGDMGGSSDATASQTSGNSADGSGSSRSGGAEQASASGSSGTTDAGGGGNSSGGASGGGSAGSESSTASNGTGDGQGPGAQEKNKQEATSKSNKPAGAIANAAAATSKAGKIAVGTVANLARGSWDVAKGKLSERISETTGGKIAASIQARSGADAEKQFGTDSLSAGSSEEVDAESEVAAFRDGGPKPI